MVSTATGLRSPVVKVYLARLNAKRENSRSKVSIDDTLAVAGPFRRRAASEANSLPVPSSGSCLTTRISTTYRGAISSRFR